MVLQVVKFVAYSFKPKQFKLTFFNITGVTFGVSNMVATIPGMHIIMIYLDLTSRNFSKSTPSHPGAENSYLGRQLLFKNLIYLFFFSKIKLFF